MGTVIVSPGGLEPGRDKAGFLVWKCVTWPGQVEALYAEDPPLGAAVPPRLLLESSRDSARGEGSFDRWWGQVLSRPFQPIRDLCLLSFEISRPATCYRVILLLGIGLRLPVGIFVGVSSTDRSLRAVFEREIHFNWRFLFFGFFFFIRYV